MFLFSISKHNFYIKAIYLILKLMLVKRIIHIPYFLMSVLHEMLGKKYLVNLIPHRVREDQLSNFSIFVEK